MTEQGVLKKIGTVFGDFKCNGDILNAQIERVNLYKAKNSFEVFLISEKHVCIKDVHYFEKFLIKRFALTSASVSIKYNECNDCEEHIKNEWNDIVYYLSYRFPMTKAILQNSEVFISENNIIDVNLHMMGIELLTARGMEKIFEDTLERIYNKKFKIKFNENISEEEIKRARGIIEQAEEEDRNIALQELESKKSKGKSDESGEANSTQNAPISNVNAPKVEELPPLPDDKDMPPMEVQEEEEITPLILRKNAKY